MKTTDIIMDNYKIAYKRVDYLWKFINSAQESMCEYDKAVHKEIDYYQAIEDICALILNNRLTAEEGKEWFNNIIATKY